MSSIKHVTVTSSRCHGEQLEDQWDTCVWCVEMSSINHVTVTSSRCHGEQLEDQWDICVWCVEMSSINHVTVTSSRCHGEPLGELCSPHRNVNKARREWSRGRGRMKIVRPRPEMSHELPYMKACAPT